MRTKVLDSCELRSAGESLSIVNDVVRYRMTDLTSKLSSIPQASLVHLHNPCTDIFIQHRLDPEKQFQNFACGTVRYPAFFLTCVPSEVSIVQVRL